MLVAYTIYGDFRNTRDDPPAPGCLYVLSNHSQIPYSYFLDLENDIGKLLVRKRRGSVLLTYSGEQLFYHG